MSDAQRNDSSGNVIFGMQVVNNTLDTVATVVTVFAWLETLYMIIEIIVIVAIIIVVSAFAGFFLYKKYPQKFAKCPCRSGSNGVVT